MGFRGLERGGAGGTPSLPRRLRAAAHVPGSRSIACIRRNPVASKKLRKEITIMAEYTGRVGPEPCGPPPSTHFRFSGCGGFGENACLACSRTPKKMEPPLEIHMSRGAQPLIRAPAPSVLIIFAAQSTAPL